jgi:hypothetical protein
METVASQESSLHRSNVEDELASGLAAEELVTGSVKREIEEGERREPDQEAIFRDGFAAAVINKPNLSSLKRSIVTKQPSSESDISQSTSEAGEEQAAEVQGTRPPGVCKLCLISGVLMFWVRPVPLGKQLIREMA